MGEAVDPALSPRLRIYPDLPAASRALARHVATIAEKAVADHGRFRLVISGGATPIPLFRRLAGRPGRKVPWKSTEVYFADERCVPSGSPESNYGVARSLLLKAVPLRPGSIHRVVTEGRSPARAAAEYDRTLRELARAVRPSPSFDLVLLGMGPDGHTASLFPRAPALRADRRRAVAVPRPGQPPRVPRVTMTIPALADSGEVCFLVAGGDKASAVRSVLGPRDGVQLPAARVASRGPISWFVDRAAAARLSGS
jgi:6-phosphogluconolactonase